MEITGVQALMLAVIVEVEPGFKCPYKQSHLHRELLSLRLPPTPNRTLGAVFIDWAHEILKGPGRRNVQILFCNKDETELYVDRIYGSLASHLYWYSCWEKGYTLWCCQKMLSSWFTVQDTLQAPDAKWDSATYTATTLQSLSHSSFDANMASPRIRDIVPELLEELKRRHGAKKQIFSMEAME
jgi:hypothetical protein